MEEVAAGVPPGANGLLGVFANIMNAKRWVQAAPSFLGFNVDDPALGARGVHQGDRGAGGIRARAATCASSRS